ncbi:MAG: sensor histidine kinase [Symbiobacteriia bacterium]
MPDVDAAAQVRRLCGAETALAPEDVERLERTAECLPLIAQLTQSDVFIDCLTRRPDTAIVVADAAPSGGRSLYSASVVGQLALRDNEPAVLATLTGGEPTLGQRGLTQEGASVSQSVVPIRGSGSRTIGALILEQDITEQVRQEVWAGVLAQTTEQLADTLFAVAMKAQTVPSLLHEGLLILDAAGVVLYANPEATRLVRALGAETDPVGQVIIDLHLGYEAGDVGEIGVVSRELAAAGVSVVLRSVPLLVQQSPVGTTILLRDVTEIRAKEQELMVKSAVIHEIHHRVKNNLQTIASLLRLQSRRTENPEIKQILAESISRIASISTVHEVLAQEGLEQVDLHRMADDIARLVRSGMTQPETPLDIQVTGPHLIIRSDKATSVALIVNELLQNAITHAFPSGGAGHVEVALEDLGEWIRVRIADDGVGLPEEFSPQDSGSLGLQIVRTLAEHDLKGRLTMDRGKDCGTLAWVDFPKGEGNVRHG